jgi:hypothetical protein
MKLENQVCSIEQGKKLTELGITAQSLFWHTVNIDPITPKDIMQKWQHSHFAISEKYPAFTLSELGQMLDSETYTQRTGSEYSEYANWEWINDGNETASGVYATEVEARAEMLITSLTNGSMSAETCNSRLVE